MSLNWANEIGKNLIKQVDVTIGDNHTIIYNQGDGRSVQFDYYKDKCVNIEHKDEKLEKDMKDMWEELKIKK